MSDAVEWDCPNECNRALIERQQEIIDTLYEALERLLDAVEALNESYN